MGQTRLGQVPVDLAVPTAERHRGIRAGPQHRQRDHMPDPDPLGASMALRSCSGWWGLGGDNKNRWSQPAMAASRVSGCSKSPTAVSTPSCWIEAAFSGERTKARAGAPASASSRTSSPPVVPVAPVTRITGSSKPCGDPLGYPHTSLQRTPVPAREPDSHVPCSTSPDPRCDSRVQPNTHQTSLREAERRGVPAMDCSRWPSYHWPQPRLRTRTRRAGQRWVVGCARWAWTPAATPLLGRPPARAGAPAVTGPLAQRVSRAVAASRQTPTPARPR